MINERYTQEGLPVVMKRLIEVLKRDYNRDFSIFGDGDDNDDSIFSREIIGLERDNGELCTYLRQCASGLYKQCKDFMTGDKIENIAKFSFMTGAVMCYAALRSQAEANRLEERMDKK